MVVLFPKKINRSFCSFSIALYLELSSNTSWLMTPTSTLHNCHRTTCLWWACCHGSLYSSCPWWFHQDYMRALKRFLWNCCESSCSDMLCQHDWRDWHKCLPCQERKCWTRRLSLSKMPLRLTHPGCQRLMKSASFTLDQESRWSYRNCPLCEGPITESTGKTMSSLCRIFDLMLAIDWNVYFKHTVEPAWFLEY